MENCALISQRTDCPGPHSPSANTQWSRAGLRRSPCSGPCGPEACRVKAIRWSYISGDFHLGVVKHETGTIDSSAKFPPPWNSTFITPPSWSNPAISLMACTMAMKNIRHPSRYYHYIYISGMSPYTLNYMDRINRNNSLTRPEPQKLSWCPTLRSRVVPEVVTDWQTPMSPVTTK